MGMLVIGKDSDGAKQNILEEHQLQSPFHQTLGEEFSFQQDYNLQHNAKSTQVAYQEDSECSWMVELQFWLKSALKSMVRLEDCCLEMINNQFDRAWRIWRIDKYCTIKLCKELWLTAVIAAKGDSNMYWLRGVNTLVNKISVFNLKILNSKNLLVMCVDVW